MVVSPFPQSDCLAERQSVFNTHMAYGPNGPLGLNRPSASGMNRCMSILAFLSIKSSFPAT